MTSSQFSIFTKMEKFHHLRSLSLAEWKCRRTEAFCINFLHANFSSPYPIGWQRLTIFLIYFLSTKLQQCMNNFHIPEKVSVRTLAWIHLTKASLRVNQQVSTLWISIVMMMSIFKDEPLIDVVGRVVDEMLLAEGCERNRIFHTCPLLNRSLKWLMARMW